MIRTGLLALSLATMACSDDGLTPVAGGSDGGTTSGGDPATSSVNTSATITATGSGGQEGGPPDDTVGGDSTGARTSAGASDGTGGESDTGEPGTGDDGPEGTSGGIDEPTCVMTGDCACNPDEVFCEALPPECPPGTVPLVDLGLACWEGSCVPAQACETVPDCTSCGEDLACVVASDLAGPSYTCQEVPPACMDVPTCECMPDACPMDFICVGMPPKGEADLGCACELC